MLHLCSARLKVTLSSDRSIGSTSRPRTPPILPNERLTGSLTPPRSSNAIRPPPHTLGYRSFLSGSTKNRNAPSSHVDSDDLDDLDFDEEEDEFGLPSVTTTRRYRINNKGTQNSAVGNDGPPTRSQQDSQKLVPRDAFDSGDIAEERNAPQYPVAKQSRGKILRPQYKDILRGIVSPHQSW